MYRLRRPGVDMKHETRNIEPKTLVNRMIEKLDQTMYVIEP